VRDAAALLLAQPHPGQAFSMRLDAIPAGPPEAPSTRSLYWLARSWDTRVVSADQICFGNDCYGAAAIRGAIELAQSQGFTVDPWVAQLEDDLTVFSKDPPARWVYFPVPLEGDHTRLVSVYSVTDLTADRVCGRFGELPSFEGRDACAPFSQVQSIWVEDATRRPGEALADAAATPFVFLGATVAATVSLGGGAGADDEAAPEQAP